LILSKAGKSENQQISRELQVIGIGFGRTGTMSFSVALKKLLNEPVYHSGNMLISDEECKKHTQLT
jgi:hypothetical protein